jgi:hypothetical protein
MTIAEVYGLKENPFEPTGAAVNKYPFVPPANFPQLEQKIEEAGIEKKLYALLVNSPHGAGKSTTMEYLKTKAINGGYLSFRVPVVLTRLSSLSIEDFVADIIREASNIINISDVERISDLIGLLTHYGGKVHVLSRSPSDLMNTTISPSFIKRQTRTLLQLSQRKCEIRFNSKLHAKATVTSQGAVSGSFNLTESGRFFNLEEGHFFPNVEGNSKKQYLEKLAWARDLFENQSRPLTEEDLKTDT